MRAAVRSWLFLVVLSLSVPALAAGGGEGDHGGDHAPSVHDINWYYGMLGEKEGVEPSVLWRPTGMPAPYGALLLNSAILYFVLFSLFKKPITEGLAKRKTTILRGMEEAARMKQEAEQQLAGYEAKLAGLDEDIARLQREMRSAGEAERARILAEARERRERMERDAHVLVEQELKAVRERLIRETLESALASAARKLKDQLGPAEQQALADRYLAEIKGNASTLRGRV
jgi:F-type H+-transporting ATPase subunit b